MSATYIDGGVCKVTRTVVGSKENTREAVVKTRDQFLPPGLIQIVTQIGPFLSGISVKILSYSFGVFI